MPTKEAREKMGWRKGRIFTAIVKTCSICNEKFKTVPSSSKQFTCSRECGGIRRARKRKELNCIYCGKTFLPRRKGVKYCSRKCGAKNRWNNHTHKIRPSDVVKRHDFKNCSICGYSKFPDILERHHLDGNRGNNEPENLSILCPNCHDEIHFLSKTGKFKWKSFWKNN